MTTATPHQRFLDALHKLVVASDPKRTAGIQQLTLVLTEVLLAVNTLGASKQKELIPVMTRLLSWDEAMKRLCRCPNDKNAQAVLGSQQLLAKEASKLFEKFATPSKGN